jgi:hypothetical protein
MRQWNLPAPSFGRFPAVIREAAEPFLTAGGLSAFFTFKDTIVKPSGLSD